MAADNSGRLAGKVAIVTGASRGIGEAIAVRYAMEGAKVAVAARTVEEGGHKFLPGSINGVVERIERLGGEGLAVQCDLSKAEDRENLVRQTEEKLGPPDILVNNGAVTFFIPVDDFSEDRFKVMIEVQVYAAFHLAQLVLPGMRERKSGWIVNMSSHAAFHPPVDSPRVGAVVYGMCKAALERFTTGLASEARDDGICVNAIKPGLIATPGVEYFGLITEENKDTVTPVEHVAEACLTLASGSVPDLSGRINTSAELMEEFGLTAAELPA